MLGTLDSIAPPRAAMAVKPAEANKRRTSTADEVDILSMGKSLERMVRCSLSFFRPSKTR